MADIKTAWGSSTALTHTLNSLGSGAARESTAVDNSTDKFLSALVRVTVNVGTVSGAAPQCLVYLYRSEDGTVYDDNATGIDAAITLESPTCLELIGVIPTPTSTKAYEKVIPVSFGGSPPRKWGIVVSNGTGAALAASGNSASYSGVYATVG